MSTSEGEEAMENVCGYCGKPATGFATIANALGEDVRYCHGDDGETPTCYEKAQWVTSGDALTVLAAWIVECVDDLESGEPNG